jgi:PhnB protein
MGVHDVKGAADEPAPEGAPFLPRKTQKAPFPALFAVAGRDLNPRPPGYEPPRFGTRVPSNSVENAGSEPEWLTTVALTRRHPAEARCCRTLAAEEVVVAEPDGTTYAARWRSLAEFSTEAPAPVEKRPSPQRLSDPAARSRSRSGRRRNEREGCTPHHEAREEAMTDPTGGSTAQHTITVHLVVRGADRAANWYAQALGAEERGRVPVPDGRFMQIELRFGDSTVMIADEFPEMGVVSPLTVGGVYSTLSIHTDDVEALWERARQAGAEVLQPLQDMFWGDRHGEIIDPFGHKWALAQHVRDVPADEVRAAAAAMFGGESS